MSLIRKQETKGITVHCEHPGVPCDSRNLAYRAAQHLSDAVGGIGGIAIDIHKRIPVAAGLAGGSANAAAVLHGVNELFGLGFKEETLMQFGAQLGADVPFCLHGGAALGLGIGDRLTRLPVLPDVPLLLLNPGIEISTATVFKKLNFSLTTQEKRGIIIKVCLEKGDVIGIGKNLYNLLEVPVFSQYPEIAALKTELSTQTGFCGALMSGSGATVFAVMHNGDAARRSESHFKNMSQLLYNHGNQSRRCVCILTIKGRWPSGKAQVFGTCMRRFESYPPLSPFCGVLAHKRSALMQRLNLQRKKVRILKCNKQN